MLFKGADGKMWWVFFYLFFFGGGGRCLTAYFCDLSTIDCDEENQFLLRFCFNR